MSDYLAGLSSRKAALDDAGLTLDRLLTARPAGLPDAATLRAMWPELPVAQRQLVLRGVFDAVVVRKHPSRSRRLAIEDRVLFIPAGTLGFEDLPRGSSKGGHVCPPFDWPGDPASPGIAGG
jgi:hypothetical protein